jgi:hypothetical protein
MYFNYLFSRINNKKIIIMSDTKHKDSSWKNVKDWSQGKARLENGILQHPDEDPKTSVYNFMQNAVTKRKELHIMPFKQYEDMGKDKA